MREIVRRKVGRTIHCRKNIMAGFGFDDKRSWLIVMDHGAIDRDNRMEHVEKKKSISYHLDHDAEVLYMADVVKRPRFLVGEKLQGERIYIGWMR